MPTGYTFNVVDGTITELKPFALQCARAFGALISMRDDPSDKPIPDEFKPSSYHTEQLELARQKLAELKAMSAEQIALAAKVFAEQKEADNRRYYEERKAENARIDAMVQKVLLWEPPSKDHVGIKDFMLEQLQTSRNNLSFSEKELGKPRLTPTAWYNAAIDVATHDIEYHSKNQREEEERAASRTKWIKELKKSLEAVS